VAGNNKHFFFFMSLQEIWSSMTTKLLQILAKLPRQKISTIVLVSVLICYYQ